MKRVMYWQSLPAPLAWGPGLAFQGLEDPVVQVIAQGFALSLVHQVGGQQGEPQAPPSGGAHHGHGGAQGGGRRRCRIPGLVQAAMAEDAAWMATFSFSRIYVDLKRPQGGQQDGLAMLGKEKASSAG